MITRKDLNRRDLNLNSSKISEVLPEYFQQEHSLLNTFLEKYYDFPYIIAELNQPQNTPHDQFMEYCDRLSKNRNLDWRLMWKDFIKKYESNMR